MHLHNPHEFDARFLEKLAECDTMEEAYLQVEDEYKRTFGEPKYRNFESYYRARRCRIKKKISAN